MSHRQHLAFLESVGVELDFDQHNSTEVEMYELLLDYQDRKIKRMEKLLSQLQNELEDNARFRLSWMAGATEGGDAQ
tara:strand:- start:127 stop:357 length:231 start_codon:yes stop_codon:yes gene_type:complete